MYKQKKRIQVIHCFIKEKGILSNQDGNANENVT